MQLQQSSRRVLTRMKEFKLYWVLRAKLQAQLTPGKEVTTEWVKQELERNGLREEALQLVRNSNSQHNKPSPISTEPVESFVLLRQRWAQLLGKGLESLLSKLKKGDIYEEEDQSVNYAYDEDMLLSAILTLRPRSIDLKLKEPCNSFIGVQLESFNPATVCLRFRPQNQEDVRKYRELTTRKIQEDDIFDSELEEYLQGGCQPGLRARVYSQLLGLDEAQEGEGEEDSPLYSVLAKGSSEQILWQDEYFIFKEDIAEMVRKFGSDKSIRERMAIVPHLFDKSPLRPEDLPPNGVLPCRGFTKLAAPFAFLARKPGFSYLVFRQFYVRFFCFLHSLSSCPNSIIHNVYLFQELLKFKEKKLVQHFGTIGLDPTRIAFPWLCFNFVGYLHVEEVFQLLDRFLGYKSTQVSVVVAVGIFLGKKNALARCTSAAEAEAVLGELREQSVRAALTSFFQ